MTTVAARPATDVLPRPRATTGLWSWFTTVDHKKIALLYGTTALFFLIVGGIEALLIRLQLVGPNGTVLTAEQYNQLFTMHGTTMVFLVGMPLAAAFGNYLIPLQIGARDVAFPRLNMFGYWVFLFGGIFLYSSFLGTAPNGGWFGYTPLTSSPIQNGALPGLGAQFWAVGIVLLGVGSTMTAINFIVTILNMRAPGMSFFRMPVFTWMMTITAFLTLFAMPVITAALIMVWFDRTWGTHFFDPVAGADPLLYQNLFWLFGHPEVYILILPGMGIVSEVLPVFSRKPLFGYTFVVFSGIAIGFMGWGVWAHHMFATGLGPVALSAFGLSTTLIGVPTGVKIFNWLGTMWRGKISLKTPMLFAIGFILMFTIGGLSGIMHSIVRADTQQTDTYFVVAHFHYVLFGGLVFGLFSGFHFWFPKVFGRMYNEKLGQLTFWLILIGFNLTFFPMHFLGLQGQPRRTFRYPEGFGWELLNQISTVGSFIIALGVLVFIVNMIVSRKYGERVGNDPWDARTLEWITPSPVPEYNFAEVPTVHARDEYWHRKYGEDEEGRAVKLPPGAGDEPAEKPGHIHMPSPSYFPFVAALALPFIGYGAVFKNLALAIIGVVIGAVGVFGWGSEPDSVEES